jgi:hypothetical protein
LKEWGYLQLAQSQLYQVALVGPFLWNRQPNQFLNPYLIALQ